MPDAGFPGGHRRGVDHRRKRHQGDGPGCHELFAGFVAGRRRVDARDDGSQPEGGQAYSCPRRHVRRPDRNHVTASDAALGERGRDRVDPVRELGVGDRPPVPAGDQRHAIRDPGGLVEHEVGERHAVFRRCRVLATPDHEVSFDT
jgi:hypothetical protein